MNKNQEKKKVKHFGYYCIGPTITHAKIEKLKQELAKSDKLELVKNYFFALAGETRLEILYLLHKEKELCVCDMADILGASVSSVSHQLKVLRVSEFVKYRKDAQTIFYSLTLQGKKELANHF
ncbi:MAG: metalloregulator ArsR/SmtB family transcription factor [Actinobacteria bacterium]|nr:metalloregulator ArsR/SmtB family transcription factor [Actinomycetota bacterium]